MINSYKEAIELIIREYWKDGPDFSLNEKTPFTILFSCILSQRSRDAQTEEASRKLFLKYRNLRELSNADLEELQALIKNVGLYKQKAKRILEAAKYILEKYNGEIPNDFHKLVKIPGIGRKCANIILAYAFEKPAIAVDTHVYTIAKRLGIVDEKASHKKVEEALMDLMPKNLWRKVNISLVRFGKAICKPIKPQCSKCPVKEVCKYYKNRGKRREISKQNL